MIRRASPADPLRVVVLVSGAGTNLQALLDAFADPAEAVRIAAVVSSQPGAQALERAAAAGIESTVFPRGDDRDARDALLAAWLRARRCELLVLAGFMEILGPTVVDCFCAVNVHPALLPAFPGHRAAADALAYGVRTTGVTVHLVDRGVDTGPVIAQEAVPVDYDDTPESLTSRLQAVEHRLLPRVISLLAADRIEVEGRQVRVNGMEDAG